MNPNYTDIFGRLDYNDRRIRAVAHTVNNPSYKVYTGLMTQTGTFDPNATQFITSGLLIVGATYQIANNDNLLDDFKNVGAPSNATATNFTATGTTPAVWTNGSFLAYNPTFPVVKVLENTIGNIYWNTAQIGTYQAFSNNLFTIGKTYMTPIVAKDPNDDFNFTYAPQLSLVNAVSYRSYQDSILVNAPFEIKVYN